MKLEYFSTDGVVMMINLIPYMKDLRIKWRSVKLQINFILYNLIRMI